MPGPRYKVGEFSVPAEIASRGFGIPGVPIGGLLEVWLLSTVKDGDVDAGATLLLLGPAEQPDGHRRLLAEATLDEPNRQALTSIVSGQRLAAGRGQPAGPRSGVVLHLEDADGWFGVEFADEEHADEWATEHQGLIGTAYQVVPLLTKADALTRMSAELPNGCTCESTDSFHRPSCHLADNGGS